MILFITTAVKTSNPTLLFLAQLIFFDPEDEEICSSETSVDFQRTTRRYIPEDSTLHNYRCENLKSYM
jgi:hypothetical protein